MKKGLSWILKSMQDSLSLPQFNGHFKTYTDEYTMRQKGVSDGREKADI